MVIKCYKVFGIVQGVNFRRQVKKIAEKLDLSGSVKNLMDNSVEIVVSGSISAIKVFINKIEASPGQAIVAKIEEIPNPYPNKKFDVFNILY